MRPEIKFGLTVAAALALAQLVGTGEWGTALLLGIIAVLSLAHALIARTQAHLISLSYGLTVNALTAVLLALLLILKNAVSFTWLLSLGTAVIVGLLAGAWLIWRQARMSPTTWMELKRELANASLVDLLLARPLNAVGSKS